jgi:hypothetical protein
MSYNLTNSPNGLKYGEYYKRNDIHWGISLIGIIESLIFSFVFLMSQKNNRCRYGKVVEVEELAPAFANP